MATRGKLNKINIITEDMLVFQKYGKDNNFNCNFTSYTNSCI